MNAFKETLSFWTNNECISSLCRTAGFLLASDFGRPEQLETLLPSDAGARHVARTSSFQAYTSLYSNNICWESAAIL